jgi:DNA modification methylase
MPLMDKDVNKIIHGDCIQQMQALPKGSVDLVFADPPFNIGFEYDVYDDKREREVYLDWSRSWISAVYRVLKDSGTFWLAIGDEYAAELKLASQEIGFHARSWVIWYYTFGVNCKQKFTRSHAHLFYFVKDPKQFTFLHDEKINRIPSARQLVYADNRANPKGRLPDDTFVLRPQDLADCFTTAEDTWYLPRVAGTFKERAGFHGCQMPEQLLGRIIKFCSQPGEIILDPFSGSATTVAVAKKLGRKYLAFDLSEDYVSRGRARLDSICVTDPLDGAPEPTISAPATAAGKGRKLPARKQEVHQETAPAITEHQWKLFEDGLLKSYRESYDGYSLDRVIADPALNSNLIAACAELGLPGDARTWNSHLFRLRKAGLLADLPTHQRTEFDWEACEPYLFASEIAWRQMIEKGCASLDEILCDPVLASEFDTRAKMWAPGFTPLEYRWAALKIRKNAKTVRSRAELLKDARLSDPIEFNFASKRISVPETSGVFIVLGSNKKAIYAGETSNLRERIQKNLREGLQKQLNSQSNASNKQSGEFVARFSTTDCPVVTRLAYQRRLVLRHKPSLNVLDLKMA